MPKAVRQHDPLDNDTPQSSREKVYARYRELREISKRHHHEILEFISGDALLNQARRLGLAQGKTLILDDVDEMNYVFDLAIYSASVGRTRAIDRYARSARFAAGSDEALMLEAMRVARFSILVIERRHETIGLVATHLVGGAEVRLVDVGLESCLPDGAAIATRLITPEQFSMTAGVVVPFDLGAVKCMERALPRRLVQGDLHEIMDDRRFVEAIYRVAIDGGATDRIEYQDLPDDA